MLSFGYQWELNRQLLVLVCCSSISAFNNPHSMLSATAGAAHRGEHAHIYIPDSGCWPRILILIDS